jgi:hypothetical protein
VNLVQLGFGWMLVSDASGSDLGGEYRAHGLDKQVYTFWELETPQRSENRLKSGRNRSRSTKCIWQNQLSIGPYPSGFGWFDKCYSLQGTQSKFE